MAHRTDQTLADLPVLAVADDVAGALRTVGRAVVIAPPGAGKTTALPLHLLDNTIPADGQRMVLLEPRRLAARAAATRMAQLLGEPVGQTVGYRMRLDTRISAATRIEVVTEGVLQRMILDDPELTGIGLLIFDEYHERSLDADFGLALALDVADGLRPDLGILVMSATLDGSRVASLLGAKTPIIESTGRSHPVTISYRPGRPDSTMEDNVASAVQAALRADDGSILAFLPGRAEINRVANRLDGKMPDDVVLHRLHGGVSITEQAAIIAPAEAGLRKVVLATAIAETAITIDGVTTVIDCGVARQPVHDLQTGVTRLETVRVSKAQAEQRAGRAGRTAPGHAIRLWAQEATKALPDFATPEIASADVSRLYLDANAFGVTDLETLAFLDPPSGAQIDSARALLQRLGALAPSGGLTAKGRAMQALPLAVRDAAMVAAATDPTERALRILLALVLSDGSAAHNETDLDGRFSRSLTARSASGKAMRAMALRLAGLRPSDEPFTPLAGWAAAQALIDGHGDRLARRRGRMGQDYLLANGRGAYLAEDDPLANHEWLVVADLSGGATRQRILAAAAMSESDVLTLCADRIETVETVQFDPSTKGVRGTLRRCIGAITLSSTPITIKAGEATAQALADGIARHGWSILATDKNTEALRTRLHWLHAVAGEPWPQADPATLAATAADWLGPYLAVCRSLSDLSSDMVEAALLARSGLHDRTQLDAMTPSHVTVPTGSRIALRYRDDGGAPMLSVRVQELFGLNRHPTVANGKVRLVIELLSPAHRPIQTTSDLPAFWAGSWREVRAEMRGRYPRHEWPEDPANALPTRRAKPR